MSLFSTITHHEPRLGRISPKGIWAAGAALVLALGIGYVISETTPVVDESGGTEPSSAGSTEISMRDFLTMNLTGFVEPVVDRAFVKANVDSYEPLIGYWEESHAVDPVFKEMNTGAYDELIEFWISSHTVDPYFEEINYPNGDWFRKPGSPF